MTDFRLIGLAIWFLLPHIFYSDACRVAEPQFVQIFSVIMTFNLVTLDFRSNPSLLENKECLASGYYPGPIIPYRHFPSLSTALRTNRIRVYPMNVMTLEFVVGSGVARAQ